MASSTWASAPAIRRASRSFPWCRKRQAFCCGWQLLVWSTVFQDCFALQVITLPDNSSFVVPLVSKNQILVGLLVVGSCPPAPSSAAYEDVAAQRSGNPVSTSAPSQDEVLLESTAGKL